MKSTAQAIDRELLALAYDNAHTHLALYAKTQKAHYYVAAQEILSHAKLLEARLASHNYAELDRMYDRQAEIDKQAQAITKQV